MPSTSTAAHNHGSFANRYGTTNKTGEYSSSSEGDPRKPATRARTATEHSSSNSSSDDIMKVSVLTRELKVLIAFFTLMNFVLGFTVSFSIVETLYLEDLRGVSVQSIAFGKSIARVPVLFRILVGAFGDRYNPFGLGHRKPYIVFGLFMTTTGYIGLAALENMHELFTVDTFTVLYYSLVTFVLSMQTIFDSAGDGLITESVPRDRVGKSQGIINFGRGIGSVFGFVGVGLIANFLSYTAVFVVMAAMMAMLVPFSFFLKEVPEDQRQVFNFAAFKIFLKPHVMVACLFVFILNMPSVGSLFLIPLFVDELNFAPLLANVALAISAVFVAVGSYVSGYLLDRFRSKVDKVFYAVTIFGVVATAGFILSLAVPGTVFLFGALGGVFIGGMLALVFALTMLLADEAIAGSFFAILSTVWKGGEIVGLAIVGPALENGGFAWAWALQSFLIAMLLPIIYYMFKLAGKAVSSNRVTKVEMV